MGSSSVEAGRSDADPALCTNCCCKPMIGCWSESRVCRLRSVGMHCHKTRAGGVAPVFDCMAFI